MFNRKPGEFVKSLGLYIHIPFCKAKCNYCDFNSYSGKEALMESYFHAVECEIETNGKKHTEFEFTSVFIGGGTPSLAEPVFISRIMNACRRNFRISDNAEISMEANPGTLTVEKLAAYKACGINRLSIGLQAWQNRLLKELGRIHSAEEFEENFKLARKAGFSNINIDLIFGLPGQKLNDWSETLSNIISLAPEHISCYSLKIEEDTVFGDRLQNGLLDEQDDELDREMYWQAVDRLSNCGYRHYEISNFARPGYECRHNLVYWKAEEYLGVGAGAHSYLNGSRFNNAYGIEEYTCRVERGGCINENEQSIDEKEAMSEFMLLGLRLVNGISMTDFRERFGRELEDVFGKTISELERKNLLERIGDRVKLSVAGLDFGNTVFMEFL